jgi:hypothetical protein
LEALESGEHAVLAQDAKDRRDAGSGIRARDRKAGDRLAAKRALGSPLAMTISFTLASIGKSSPQK